MNGWGALVGLAYGAGGASLALYDGPWRALRFHQRVRAGLTDTSLPRRLTRRSLQLLGSSRQQRIESRQLQAGIHPDASTHVLQCITGTLIGVAASAAVLIALTGMHQLRRPFAVMLLMVLAAVSGWLVVDARLGKRVRTRQQAASVALPAFVEAIALTVSAGAALSTALEIVSVRSTGVLAEGLRSSVAAMRDGSSVDEALQQLVQRFPLPALSRLVSAVLTAIERGTPIVEVLHAQAQDARQESRRLLLESAGRREVGMLVPVIFFVLPAVVVVALYPGFQELSSIAT